MSQLFEQTPELAKHGQQFTAERSLEYAQLKTTLYDEYEIRPLTDCNIDVKTGKAGSELRAECTDYAPAQRRRSNR